MTFEHVTFTMHIRALLFGDIPILLYTLNGYTLRVHLQRVNLERILPGENHRENYNKKNLSCSRCSSFHLHSSGKAAVHQHRHKQKTFYFTFKATKYLINFTTIDLFHYFIMDSTH